MEQRSAVPARAESRSELSVCRGEENALALVHEAPGFPCWAPALPRAAPGAALRVPARRHSEAGKGGDGTGRDGELLRPLPRGSAAPGRTRSPQRSPEHTHGTWGRAGEVASGRADRLDVEVAHGQCEPRFQPGAPRQAPLGTDGGRAQQRQSGAQQQQRAAPAAHGRAALERGRGRGLLRACAAGRAPRPLPAGDRRPLPPPAPRPAGRPEGAGAGRGPRLSGSAARPEPGLPEEVGACFPPANRYRCSL